MPTYDYSCQACGAQMEIVQKITDAKLTCCPKCQQQALQRGVGGGIGLAFKGSGFYITDYPDANKSPHSLPPSQKPQNSCCPCGKDKGSCSS